MVRERSYLAVSVEGTKTSIEAEDTRDEWFAEWMDDR